MGEARALTALCFPYEQRGQLDEALDHHTLALKIREEIGQSRRSARA